MAVYLRQRAAIRRRNCLGKVPSFATRTQEAHSCPNARSWPFSLVMRCDNDTNERNEGKNYYSVCASDVFMIIIMISLLARAIEEKARAVSIGFRVTMSGSRVSPEYVADKMYHCRYTIFRLILPEHFNSGDLSIQYLFLSAFYFPLPASRAGPHTHTH